MTAGATRTTCPYCGVGCGISVATAADGAVTVRGDAAHPANFGRLCSKGSALAQTIGLEGRLLTPMVDGKAAGWDAALERIASAFSATIAKHGPDSVAFYVSGQLLTEDYYVINKLAKGFVGTANIDTNSRLCMASSVAGHKRAFGSDTVPGNYEDLERADLLVLAGSNAAWCHPVLYQRMIAAKAANPRLRLVVIDPRRTDSCDGADLHLPLRSGTDAVLFNGLLAHLARSGRANARFVAASTRGAKAALAACADASVEATAQACGLEAASVRQFFDWFAATRKTVTLYSQGINQSTSGTDKVNAIINCHLLTGRIGHPGMGPFSLTGQPNAMGGREVGGLANQLAAHMEIGDPAHRQLVQDFWQSPRMADKAGLKAVEMFEAIGAGRIKAVWIMSTNPVVSLPDAERARKALAACDFVAVSDCMADTDTTRFAHVLLPASAWGEKSGTVTNSERRISRQRAFLPAPGEARPDWQHVCGVAKRMGFVRGFDFTSPAGIFREHAALSGIANNGSRDFDISALSTLADAAYDDLAPVQWPVTATAPHGTARLFSDGRFFTPDRKARLIAVTPRAPLNAPRPQFPFILNTGRVRDHWHTMTRTGKSARLSGHMFEPFVEVHPDDAARLGLTDRALARVATAHGAMIARVAHSADQQRGSLYAPMHWSGAFASAGRVNPLVNAAVDPISGQPESKHTPARIALYQPQWQAFCLSRSDISQPAADWWVRGRAEGHWRYELAGDAAPADWDACARTLMGPAAEGAAWLAYRDPLARRYRFAAIRDGRLEACVFAGPDHGLAPRSWLAGLFAKARLSDDDRAALLAGRPRAAGDDRGPVVCACFGIGRSQIATAISVNGADSVAAIGTLLQAGTSCGSCKPELSRMLKDAWAKTPA